MVHTSSNGMSLRLRLGVPGKDGDFRGLALDHSTSLGAIVVGGAIAVAIVWLATRHQPAQRDALEAPTKLAVTRATASSN